VAIDVLPHLSLVRRSAPAIDRVRHALTWMRRRTCALSGHDFRLRGRDDRIFLSCDDCGFETAGWTIGPRRPRRTAE
jgi:hypothetical protein